MGYDISLCFNAIGSSNLLLGCWRPIGSFLPLARNLLPGWLPRAQWIGFQGTFFNPKAAIFHWKIDNFRWSFSLKPIHWSARLNISMSQNARFCQWSRRSNAAIAPRNSRVLWYPVSGIRMYPPSHRVTFGRCPGVPSPSSPWLASCLQVWYSHPWATVGSRLQHVCSMTGKLTLTSFPPTIRIHTDPYGISMYLPILFPLLPKRFLKARDQQRKNIASMTRAYQASIGIPCHPCTRHPSMYHPCTIHVPAQFHRHFRLRTSASKLQVGDRAVQFRLVHLPNSQHQLSAWAGPWCVRRTREQWQHRQ